MFRLALFLLLFSGGQVYFVCRTDDYGGDDAQLLHVFSTCVCVLVRAVNGFSFPADDGLGGVYSFAPSCQGGHGGSRCWSSRSTEHRFFHVTTAVTASILVCITWSRLLFQISPPPVPPTPLCPIPFRHVKTLENLIGIA